ncbi:MAG TPA: imidazole glycerol phosphate synthase subunit HisH [Bacteroidales bacterium]
MNVVIIKYNAGNIYSVDYALKRLGLEAVVTADPELIRKADKVIFPGQGEAVTTMKYLRERHLDELICDLKQPVLGICLGLQLMCRFSEEGNTTCLGIFDTEVKKFVPQRHEDKVPHMGWNTIYDCNSPLFKGIETVSPYVYFVHSYYVPINPYAVTKTDYIVPFTSAIHKDNFYATQYHPEKSGKTGELILQNFLDL